MFYEVRILDSKGKVKKVLNGKKLSNNYWKDFYDKVKSKSPMASKAAKNKKGNDPVKNRKADPDQFEDEYSLTDE
jgi:CRISPR/Cas system CSM-associated protein Csm2 small subunit